MRVTLRQFLVGGGAMSALATIGGQRVLAGGVVGRQRHIVSLSFDDGFKKSFIWTAEIFEKFKLAACLNVLAEANTDDGCIRKSPMGDFVLWNELQQRGHEIMPHGYRHENLQELPFEKGKDLIQRCLGVFSDKLTGFDPKQAIFNFPYNASTPELEQWLPGQVRAFRSGWKTLNPLPSKSLAKLTCSSFGPANCEAAVDQEIRNLLARESGWIIFNTHGLDDEGWGPMRATYLERLLERLLKIETVEILPVGRALAQAVS
jgi:peptidoglycan/xylan/chitin deacetylase (PgdA/CDA1 family)